MKPTSTKPRWARRKASVIPGSIVARRPARISLVEIGSRPGGGGAGGRRVQVGTGGGAGGAGGGWAGTGRAPAAFSMSCLIAPCSGRREDSVGGLRGVQGASFAGELARPARSVGGPRRG